MDASDNLISLADVSSVLSASLHPPNPMEPLIVQKVEEEKGADASGATGLLVDLEDEIQVPLPSAILTQAEVDDTFGIFSMAQSSQLRNKNPTVCSWGNDAKTLVRSFTSGRKSEEVPMPSSDAKVELHGCITVTNKIAEDEFDKSTTAVHTIKEAPSELKNLSFPEANENDFGISDEKMDLSKNFSGGSDSDILDIHNLSSFSLPDMEMADEDFIENIKKEDMAVSLVSGERVKQIKKELLVKEEPAPNHRDLVHPQTKPGENSTSSSSLNRQERPRLSSMSSSSFRPTSTPLTIEPDNEHDDTIQSTMGRNVVSSPATKVKSRLSVGFMNSSPIRSSYPIPKFFMPTPNTKTPSRLLTTPERNGTKSKYSPSKTRNVLVTGESLGSPLTKVPVRKSISCETLHFGKSPLRDMRPVPKFSTPSAAARSRYSFSISEVGEDSGKTLKMDYGGSTQDIRTTGNAESGYQQLSCTSSVSSNSLNKQGLSPKGGKSNISSPLRRDMLRLNTQMKDTHLTVTTTSRNLGITRIAACSSSAVQPMKATAVIQPSKEYTGEEVPTPVINAPPPVARNSVSLQSGCGSKSVPVPAKTASSPRTAPSPYRLSQKTLTTPSKRTSMANTSSVKSSGYGPQRLNLSFGGKPPLISPNKIPPPASASGLQTSFNRGTGGSKVESRAGNRKTIGGGTLPPKILKAPGVPVTSGLRRPTFTANKENSARASLGPRTGLGRPRP